MKKILISLGLIFTCLFLVACGPFQGFDDDSAIIKGNNSSLSLSMVNENASRYYHKVTGKFNGVIRIKNVTFDYDNPTIKMDLTINGGKFKVVLVKDDNVYLITSSNTSNSIETTIKAGTYNLRLVGVDAKFELTYYF